MESIAELNKKLKEMHNTVLKEYKEICANNPHLHSTPKGYVAVPHIEGLELIAMEELNPLVEEVAEAQDGCFINSAILLKKEQFNGTVDKLAVHTDWLMSNIVQANRAGVLTFELVNVDGIKLEKLETTAGQFRVKGDGEDEKTD